MKLQDFDFMIWNNNSKTYEAGSILESLGFITSVFNQLTYEKPTIDYEIELWTGYFDKNGKKIYEGDILEYTRWCEQYMEDAEHSETIYEVVCFDTNGGLYSKLLNGEFGWFFEHFMNDKNNTIEEMSIIGNIHENKELLNVRL